eukprot:2298292-Prymnesium_polylepis.3
MTRLRLLNALRGRRSNVNPPLERLVRQRRREARAEARGDDRRQRDRCGGADTGGVAGHKLGRRHARREAQRAQRHARRHELAQTHVRVRHSRNDELRPTPADEPDAGAAAEADTSGVDVARQQRLEHFVGRRPRPEGSCELPPEEEDALFLPAGETGRQSLESDFHVSC